MAQVERDQTEILRGEMCELRKELREELSRMKKAIQALQIELRRAKEANRVSGSVRQA